MCLNLPRLQIEDDDRESEFRNTLEDTTSIQAQQHDEKEVEVESASESDRGSDSGSVGSWEAVEDEAVESETTVLGT
jgi:hypothetical protein